MTTNNHTAVSTGAAANAATLNSPLGQLDAAIGNLTTLSTTAKSTAVAAINEVYGQAAGGAAASDQLLKSWVEGEAYELTAITYNTTYPRVVASATVKWPDGSAGTFTATTTNTTWQAVDAYTITHTASSKTVTQAAVTRNTIGIVTTKPALTVA